MSYPTPKAYQPVADFLYSAEVDQALRTGKPVVALESTIISHGMPYPQNFETAKEVEAIVKDGGSVPATIAILDGKICIGLTDAQLLTLSTSGESVQKCSRRDLAYVCAVGGHGATTVAATMHLAHLAGIHTFVTGGIGGVHRGGERSMDISADLQELGSTPVTVVCAGVKSILDIPRTLEVLETHGVPVVSLRSDEFPSFFTSKSGVPTPLRLDGEAEIARMMHAARKLQLCAGMVVAVPPPPPPADTAETGSMSDEEREQRVHERIGAAIETALCEADADGVSGKAVTPFMLKRVAEATKGASLASNIALIKQNARVGAAIAAAYAAPTPPEFGGDTVVSSLKSGGVVVVGGATVDVLATAAPGMELLEGTSTPGSVDMQFGGVGRNIAECVARLASEAGGQGPAPLLLAAVGADAFGKMLVDNCADVGIRPEGILAVEAESTALYVATFTAGGDLGKAVADMAVLSALSPTIIDRFSCHIRDAAVVVADGNLGPDALAAVCDALAAEAEDEGIGGHRMPALWFEPTSVAKSVVPVSAGLMDRLSFVSPNLDELLAMAVAVDPALGGRVDAARDDFEAQAQSTGSRVAHVEQWAAPLLPFVLALLDAMGSSPSSSSSSSSSAPGRIALDPQRQRHIVLTLGSCGVLTASASPQQLESWRNGQSSANDADDGICVTDDYDGVVDLLHTPPSTAALSVTNCTGAGDSLVGAATWALSRGLSLAEAMDCGVAAAELSLAAPSAVSPSISVSNMPHQS